ncbi:hypothetical protein [Trichlorobacter lovleyi]|uniref:Uncharacterized protein n=1 Tax=Trichlorobacter lovleyi (strain ATCC BAA-1151 / DSM 17278 / SZ) TaxID=398767 RepID=B3E8Q5_TRIL1|nr:hypothetical protein [Trichlorobacter lovleyi]ACD93758.1 hypothetical protein Glov_0020 [Trichlorobacter lovleyi SZ]
MSLSFLSHSAANSLTCCKRPGENVKYTPLFGVWLIDIILYFGWHRPSHPRRWPDIFEDSDFCAMTALDTDHEEQPERVTAGHCMKLLVRQRQKLAKKKLSDSLPFFRNIKLLTGMLNLTVKWLRFLRHEYKQ